jgi:hypothetical protein
MMDNEMNRINQGSIPTLNGSAGKYLMWWTKFISFAAINGLSEVIRSDPRPYLPKSWDTDFNSSAEDGKRQFHTKKLNNLAVSCFTMALMKEGIMRLVSKAKNKEWPDGLAYIVVRELDKKYKPRDILSRVEMQQRLNQVQMKKGSDPALLFETLAAIKDQYDGVEMIDKSYLIDIVLDVAINDGTVGLKWEPRILTKKRVSQEILCMVQVIRRNFIHQTRYCSWYYMII